jgi:hypothetical protein
LPKNYVGHPTFQRNAVEFRPDNNQHKSDLIEEPEISFSRSAVESVPATR